MGIFLDALRIFTTPGANKCCTWRQRFNLREHSQKRLAMDILPVTYLTPEPRYARILRTFDTPVGPWVLPEYPGTLNLALESN